MATNTTNNEMLTVTTDSAALACREACPECPDSDVYTMTHTSDAIRRHAEEHNLKVIDVPLSTIDDADCDGLPEYDPETGVVKYTW